MRAVPAPAEIGGEHASAGSSLKTARNHLIIFAVLLLAWELAVRFNLMNPLLTPRPTDIARSLVTIYLVQGNIWWHIFVTLGEALAGFFIGSAIGIGLAVAAGLNDAVRRYLQPYVVLTQVTPRVAIAPIMIAWLGFGWSPKIAIAALICMFAPFINTLAGILSVDREKEEMFRSMRATKAQIFWKLMLPHSMPVIFAGLRTAISLALAGAIVAEFVAANQGTGLLIQRYSATLNMASAFAVLLSLTAIGFILYKLAELVDERLVYWQHPDRLVQISRKRSRSFNAG